MTKIWLGGLMLFGVSLVGCQLNQKADADPASYTVNEAFGLGGGREAVIQGENLRLRFDDVLEDSRCPKGVECFWTGQARIAIRVLQAGDSTTLEFNTNPAPGQNRQSIPMGEYTIQLWSLDPYPQTPDDSPALEDYRASLVVLKN
jgi:hypothetical protein